MVSQDQARVVYDAQQRAGSITMPSGKVLKFANVSREQFACLIEKHDQRFGRAGDARANSFTR